jgi:ArsR family transcriptional regulator, arsenate/arsenite/antimonite-responsive transcriptional repressor
VEAFVTPAATGAGTLRRGRSRVREAARPAECCPAITASTLGDREASMTATLFKALSDPHRIRIVNLLANSSEPVCVCDITSAVKLSQPTTSFHLAKLVRAGLLDREQRGVWGYYSLNRKAIDRLGTVFSTEGRT